MWSSVQDVIASAGSMAGKTVISCINPIKSDFSGLEIGTTTSAAEEVAKLIPDAHVVEVLFPFAEILQSNSRQFKTEQRSQFFYEANAVAKEKVAQLILDIGLLPIDVGALANARYLEPVGMLLVQLAYANRMGTHIGLKLINT